MRRFFLDRYAHRLPLRVGCLSQCFSAERVGADGVAQPVLLKQLLPALAREPSVAARWLEFAEQNMALQHVGCAQILDLGYAEDEPFLAVEKLDAVSLRDLLVAARTAGAWPDENAVIALAFGVLEALVHAQVVGIPHLDLHTESVLVRSDGSVVLTECSLFRALPHALATRQRFNKGRAAYLSPELARAEEGDFRSDVFSLGVLLFELAAKQRPFDGTTQLTTAMQIASGKRQPLRSVAGHVGEGFCDIVETMLAVAPLERFQSPRAALGAFTATCARDPEDVRDWFARLRPYLDHAPVAAQGPSMAPAAAPPYAPGAPPLAAPAYAAGAPDAGSLAPPPLMMPRASSGSPPNASSEDAWLSPPPLLSPGAGGGLAAGHVAGTLPADAGDAPGVRDGKTAFLDTRGIGVVSARGPASAPPAFATPPPLVAHGAAAHTAAASAAPALGSPRALAPLAAQSLQPAFGEAPSLAPPPVFAAPPAFAAPPSFAASPPVSTLLARAPAHVAPMPQALPPPSGSALPGQLDEPRWHEPSKTVFQRKVVVQEAPRRAKAHIPLYAVILLATLFSCALVVAAVLLWRLLA